MSHASTSRLMMPAALAVLLVPASASAQGLDLRAMSGRSMPSPDLPDGTVTVRVVRGEMTNNLPGVAVELHGAGANRTATTGADGRAQFTNVPPGSNVHAHAVVDGQSLDSEPFAMPSRGGVRTLLVASAAEETPGVSGTDPPPGSGSGLSIGGNSRIVAEFSEDLLQVFYLFEIVNRTNEPITPASALIFDMPVGAVGTTVLEGSTPQANARGSRVTVTGPFRPGVTPLQMAFRLDGFGSRLTLESRFPLPLDMVAIAVQKAGDMKVSSPQVERTQETALDTALFVMGTGPRLSAGAPLLVHLEGLPHRRRTGMYLALALALAIVAAGVWLSLSPASGDPRGSRRRALEARRERGLAALAALEAQHRAGRVRDAQYAERRAVLLAQLERIYGELDAPGGTPGGQDLAA